MLGPLLILCCQLDLGERYPTVAPAPGLFGHGTTAGPQDVYRLSGFEQVHGSEFVLECGPATLVVGHGALGPMWAVVLPDEPGALRHAELPEIEPVASLYLRFPGDALADLVPADTVLEPVDAPAALFEARALFGHKVGGTFQVNGRPIAVPAGLAVFDADTTTGRRRVVLVEGDKAPARYVPGFADRALAPSPSLAEGAAGRAFDAVVAAFDAEYATFGLVPELDWTAHAATWRDAAAAAHTDRQLAAALGCLLEPLGDAHVDVTVAGGQVPVHATDWWINANFRAILVRLGELQRPAQRVQFARTPEGLGYVLVDGLVGEDLAAGFDAALEALADTWGLILDLRFNGGGDERIGQQLAGRFRETAAVYAKSRYRSGPEHSDLGPWHERSVEPRGPWRYASPVLVLQGPRTMSSAEALVWMLRGAEQVATFGSPTQGASANPRLLELPQHAIAVRLPRWLAAGPEGERFERIGIAPDVPFEAPLDAFDDAHDPCLDAAIAHLERTVPPAERQPGRRD